MWSRIANTLRKRTDDLSRLFQDRGLAAAARLARRSLGESAIDEEWSPWEYRALDAILDRMCEYDRGFPRPADTVALESTLDFIDTFPDGRRRQIRNVLAVFEAGSRLLGPGGSYRRFTELGADDATAYLRSWQDSQLPPRRAVFRALKSVCMVAYWSQPESWDEIGYSLADNPGLDLR